MGVGAWTQAEMRVPKLLLSGKGTNAKYVIHHDSDGLDTSTSLGRFNISMEGGSGSGAVGYITMQYSITLRVAQAHKALYEAGYYNVHGLASAGAHTTWLDHLNTVSPNTNMADRVSIAGNTITFAEDHPGKFHVMAYGAPTAGTQTNFPASAPTGTSGVSVHKYFVGNTGSKEDYIIGPTSASTTAAFTLFDIHVTALGGTLSFEAGVIGSTTHFNLLIYELPPGHNFKSSFKVGDSTRERIERLKNPTRRVDVKEAKEMARKLSMPLSQVLSKLRLREPVQPRPTASPPIPASAASCGTPGSKDSSSPLFACTLCGQTASFCMC